MIRIFKTFGGYIEIPKVKSGCWINVTTPTLQEIQRLKDEFRLPADTINDILDADERPRIELDDDWSLVILRIPVQNDNNGVPFHTIPLGIYMAGGFTLTLCLQENEILPLKEPLPFREQYRQVSDVTNFILRLFLRSGNLFLKYLKQINQMTSNIEQDLEKSIKNRELNKLLSTLKNKQALEMARIYSDIQSGMMDAFASVISNNLNGVMKQLTLISIILMIPTLIASIFGMNVPNFMESSDWALPLILFGSLFLSFSGVILFRTKHWF